MVDLKEWLARRKGEDERLYERYGKPLEDAHKGRYVAIGPEGQVILGDEEIEVFGEAVDTFGSGDFAFRRVGYRAVWKWRFLHQ